MRVEDYLNLRVGTPWVKGSDDVKNGGLDCWGFVVDSYRNIEQIEIRNPFNRVDCNLDDSAKKEIKLGGYVELESKKNGCIVACFKDGEMVHIGRFLCNQFYHASGNVKSGGAVCGWKMKLAEKMYDLKFYEVTSGVN